MYYYTGQKSEWYLGDTGTVHVIYCNVVTVLHGAHSLEMGRQTFLNPNYRPQVHVSPQGQIQPFREEGREGEVLVRKKRKIHTRQKKGGGGGPGSVPAPPYPQYCYIIVNIHGGYGI